MAGFSSLFSNRYNSFGVEAPGIRPGNNVALPIPGTKTVHSQVETNDLTEHYVIAASGLYSQHQYADISLLRRKQN